MLSFEYGALRFEHGALRFEHGALSFEYGALTLEASIPRLDLHQLTLCEGPSPPPPSNSRSHLHVLKKATPLGSGAYLHAQFTNYSEVITSNSPLQNRSRSIISTDD